MKKMFKSALSLVLVGAMTASTTVTAFAARTYNDFDYITSHIDFGNISKLSIASPSKDITTSSDAYYITGTSNPNQTLYCNGSEVTNRGSLGSFGLYVTLSGGENVFTFTQNDVSKSVTITKGGSGVTTTNRISAMLPSYDSAYHAGETLKLSCTAPSGASVTATVFGQNVTMKQVAATAQAGVPAKFTCEVTVVGVNAPTDMGKVKYTMNYNGNTKSYTSSGNICVYPQNTAINIQIADTSAALYKQSSTNDVDGVLKIGGIDTVVSQTDDRYELSMGGWVRKDSVQPLLNSTSKNNVSSTDFSKTIYGERFKLQGTTTPIVNSWQDDEKLYVELFNTSGLTAISTANSNIFSGATVTPKENSIVIEFSIASGKQLYGHVVEYKDNVTTIYCKYPPKAAGGNSKPLLDVVVGLDAGHGGSDTGAVGTTGVTEAEITQQTAIAVKKRLESLGATVLMTQRRPEGKTSYVDRMQAAQDGKADFYISLHCNSIAGNGTKANGIEVYYYYTRHKAFAETMQRSLVNVTGRTDRNAKFNLFRVTMNPLAPSVLIEMGFISNPTENDKLMSKQGIFEIANGISDCLIDYIN